MSGGIICLVVCLSGCLPVWLFVFFLCLVVYLSFSSVWLQFVRLHSCVAVNSPGCVSVWVYGCLYMFPVVYLFGCASHLYGCASVGF